MRSAHRGRRNRIVVAESRGGGVRPRGHDGARLRGPEAATSGAGKRGLRSDERPRRGRPRERRESARAGLLSSRRRRGCRFAAVPGHQRLDRPTLGRGDDGRVGDKRSLGRKGDASPGRPAAGCVPAVFLVAGRREGHRAAKFRQRIAPRGSSKCVRPPSFPRIPRAHAEPSDHHHRAKRQEQPGGERRAHEKPHRRDVRRGGDHHRRNRRWLIELGARVWSWELDRRRRGRLRRAGGGPRGRGRRGGRRDRSRPRHRSLVRLQHHIPELQVRTRARDVYPRHSVPGRFSFEQPSPPPRRRVVEKVRIDRDGHRGPRRWRRARAAVEPVPSCLRRLRCTCEIESNLERGEGTSGAEPKDVPGARVDVERRRERERSPRRELRPYHAVARGVDAPEIPYAEPLRGRGEGRRRR